MGANAIIIHGGGPTAVLNSSLYGVIKEAKESKAIDKLYAAIGGSEAVLKEQLLDLLQFPNEKIELLLNTPATAIGTSRFELEKEHYEAMVEVFSKNNIKYVFLNGGNGTMDTCGKIYKECKGKGIYVVGIPKTMDNDIAITDHTPGFGSAARYIAATTAEVGVDVKSLPIHVCIIEAMGRNAGWITAASALARKKEGDAPHLIYLPERAFNEEEFLEDVKKIQKERGGVVVVVSEGLKDKTGKPIVEPVFQTGRSVYYGDVSAYLATLVIRKLGIKARNEKPGLCGRASIAWQSPIDREEAIFAGREAVKAALEGESGIMIGFIRDSKEEQEYKMHTERIPIAEVMLHERVMPSEYINDRGNNVTDKFINWCKPLIGSEVNHFIDFKDYI